MFNAADPARADITIADAFARGYSAGSFACRYTSTDFDAAWEVAVDDSDLHDAHRRTLECSAAFYDGFLLGFFSSSSEHEIASMAGNAKYLDDWRSAAFRQGFGC